MGRQEEPGFVYLIETDDQRYIKSATLEIFQVVFHNCELGSGSLYCGYSGPCGVPPKKAYRLTTIPDMRQHH